MMPQTQHARYSNHIEFNRTHIRRGSPFGDYYRYVEDASDPKTAQAPGGSSRWPGGGAIASYLACLTRTSTGSSTSRREGILIKLDQELVQ
jgi:hypothetical protein